MHAHTHSRTSWIHAYIHTITRTYTCLHTRTHVHAHTHTHTHTHTHQKQQHANREKRPAMTVTKELPTLLYELVIVSWCLEPSQPQTITSGLKTNFSLFPGYSFHRSLYHKSLFLKPHPKLYPQFRNANPEKQQHMFWGLFIFRGHSAREPASIVK